MLALAPDRTLDTTVEALFVIEGRAAPQPRPNNQTAASAQPGGVMHRKLSALLVSPDPL